MIASGRDEKRQYLNLNIVMPAKAGIHLKPKKMAQYEVLSDFNSLTAFAVSPPARG